MKKKYIFLDIDGTLVTGAAVPESAHEALVRAKNAGHELILCTGRSLCEIFPFLLEDFEFDGIISSSGGAVKRGGYECIHAIGENDCAELCGYFDENHFAYLEDIDIGYRANIYGYPNQYVPQAVVYHAGSAVSGSRHNEFKVRLSAANSIYLIYKMKKMAR